MATKLKNLKITSTDLVDAGANPDAHIRLFKRNDAEDKEADGAKGGTTGIGKIAAELGAALKGVFAGMPQADGPVGKDAATFRENIGREALHALTQEMYGFCYALSDSLASIICDEELDEGAKHGLMLASLAEFDAATRGAAPKWAAGNAAGSVGIGKLAKPQGQQAADAALWESIGKELGGEPPGSADEGAADAGIGKSHSGDPNEEKEESDTMRIDKSLMTAEELATLADFEKRYGASGGEGADQPPEMHPEVKKALADFEAAGKAQAEEIESLRKSLEIERLTAAAKKYDVIGKNAEELAAKLYELKKAGGTAYDDYVALLDEQTALVEKSGIFTEIGKNTSGSAGAAGQLDAKAAEIRKANPGMARAEAFVKAYEENPEIAAQYEAEMGGGK